MHQEKQRSKNKSNDPTVSVVDQEQQYTPKLKAKDKRKTICLGVEAQKMLPNPDIRLKQTASSSKSSSSTATTDKFAKKPSHEKWDNDRVKVTTALASSSSTSSDTPTTPTRQRGAGNLRKAPKRTDAYSPTTAAAQEQWDRRPIYVPFDGDYSNSDVIVTVEAIIAPDKSSATDEIGEEQIQPSIDNWDQPTVQNVTAAHTDTDEVNVSMVSGETRHDIPSVECQTKTREPLSSRILATEGTTGQEQLTASDRTSGEATRRLMLGSKTREGIADVEYHEMRPEESILPVLLDSTGSTQSSAVLPEEAPQSTLPLELTGHTPTEVGVAEKPPPSPRESVLSGNVHGQEKTPVESASTVRDAIPGDLLFTEFPLEDTPQPTSIHPVPEDAVPATVPEPTKTIRDPVTEDAVPAPVPEPTKTIRDPVTEDAVPAPVPEPTKTIRDPVTEDAVPAPVPEPTKTIRDPVPEDAVPAPVPEPTKTIRDPVPEDAVPAPVPEPTKTIRDPVPEDAVPAPVPEPTKTIRDPVPEDAVQAPLPDPTNTNSDPAAKILYRIPYLDHYHYQRAYYEALYQLLYRILLMISMNLQTNIPYFLFYLCSLKLYQHQSMCPLNLL